VWLIAWNGREGGRKKILGEGVLSKTRSSLKRGATIRSPLEIKLKKKKMA